MPRLFLVSLLTVAAAASVLSLGRAGMDNNAAQDASVSRVRRSASPLYLGLGGVVGSLTPRTGGGRKTLSGSKSGTATAGNRLDGYGHFYRGAGFGTRREGGRSGHYRGSGGGRRFHG